MEFFTVLLFCLAIQTDTFIVSFAYGSSQIKIPIMTTILINAVSCFILLASLIFANIIETFINPILLNYIGCGILFIMGGIKIYSEVIIKKYKRNKLQFFDGYTKADTNNDKILSLKESVSLAIAISADGFFAGFSLGVFYEKIYAIIAICFVIGFAAILLGIYVGNKIAKKSSLNLSYMSGVLLMGIAILKI